MAHKKIIEAALFMSARPLQLTELAKITGLSSLGKLKGLLEELESDYGDRGIQVVQGQQGWHMQVRQDLLSNVAHLTPYSDLSEGCKRTLALVIYKEPAMQSDLIKIQGNKAYNYIHRLERMGLIKTQKTGRTKRLILTQEFENYFGEEKERIKEKFKEQYASAQKPEN
jgi:segregation and condensation protein B